MAAATKTKPVANKPQQLTGPQGQHRFQPGESGNPLGRPKAVLEVVAAAREHTEAAISTLATLTTKAKSPQARIMAATALLDRGWGKPVQPVLDETPKANLFEGWPEEQVRAFGELMRMFKDDPQGLQLLLAQLRIRATEEVKAW